jgi:hypothetical protein
MNARIAPILAVIFILTFAASGCTSNDTSETVVKSSEGLSIEFQPGAPPEQVSEDDPSFEASIKLDNMGEYDIKLSEAVYDEVTGKLVSGEQPISVFLLGVNPATLDLCETVTTTVPKTVDGVETTEEVETQVCNTELVFEDGLGGAHYVNNELIPGELTYVNWESPTGSALQYALDISSDQQLNFVAQVCYPYRTTAITEACFSDNAYAQTTGSETCTVSGDKDASNTIAPIKVTNIVENPAGKVGNTGKYAFTITVENTGGGSVFPYDKSIHDCTQLGVGELNANQVAVMSVKVGGVEKMECLKSEETVDDNGDTVTTYKPSRITLVDGKGTYTCTLSQEAISGDYADVFEVVLAYNYYTQTKKEVVVKNTLNFDE